MAKNKKIVKYRKPFSFNLGVVVFAIIFLYMCYNVFTYMNTTHVSVYEVQQGEISKNTTYRGMILRDESIVNADSSGYVNYYRSDASKVSTQSVVYTVDSNGDVYQKINEADSDGSLIDSEDLGNIEDTVNNYMGNYSDMSFYNLYTFKTNLNSQVSEDISLAALDSLSDYISYAQNANTFQLYYAPQPGIITYYTDGYEAVTADSFTSDMFNEANYTKTDLRSQTSVEAGNPVYKLLTNEQWNIIVPIESTVAEELKDESVIEVNFTEDNYSAWATTTILDRDGEKYLQLTFKTAMVRYASERFINIELVMDDTSGLKIPNSAITSKEFYTVPKEYFVQGGDSNAYGLFVETTDESGESSTEFIETDFFYATDTDYYIDESDITLGTVIVVPDSNDRYTINTSASLEGVYNINKGYAVFKQIDILYQSEEYTIVSAGTTYGIALYDHIALDGTTIQENELIH